MSWWIPIVRLLAALQMVDHHLEVIEDRDAKLSRLRALVQVYHLIQEKQIVPGCFWVVLKAFNGARWIWIDELINSFYVREGRWKKSLTTYTYDYNWNISKLYPSCYSTCTILFFQPIIFSSFQRDMSNHNVTISRSNWLQRSRQVVVANTINLRRILDMISQSFAGTDFRCLDQNTPENIRDWAKNIYIYIYLRYISQQFEWIFLPKVQCQ